VVVSQPSAPWGVCRRCATVSCFFSGVSAFAPEQPDGASAEVDEANQVPVDHLLEARQCFTGYNINNLPFHQCNPCPSKASLPTTA
jgi:hypothetical protein